MAFSAGVHGQFIWQTRLNLQPPMSVLYQPLGPIRPQAICARLGWLSTVPCSRHARGSTMAQRVNFLSQSVSKTPRHKNLRWAWGLALGVLGLVFGYVGWPALADPSASDNETRSRQLQEFQALQDKQRLLASWTVQRWQVLDAIHQLATGWPSLWVLAPRPALSLTSLHVSAQEVRIQALSKEAPELPRWDPTWAPSPAPRSALGSPELLELTHAAPAATSGTTAAPYLVSVRLPWRMASDR